MGKKALGKPIGTYVTVDIKNLKIASETEIEKAALSIKRELVDLINKKCSENKITF